MFVMDYTATQNVNNCVKFEVFTALAMKINIV
jgi:hypothetical protein